MSTRSHRRCRPPFPGTVRGDARRRGTATAETVLILIPLLLVVALAPWIAGLFLHAQLARTEAHRDTFDKTTTVVIFPEALMNNHVAGEMAKQFGPLTPVTRRHAFAQFPVDVPKKVNKIIDPPDTFSVGVEIVKGMQLDLYDEGFPNSTVEGWGYVRYRNPFDPEHLPERQNHFMAYGAVIRSPWTYLGWPAVPTQDVLFEPKIMEDWQDATAAIDDDMREALKLAE